MTSHIDEAELDATNTWVCATMQYALNIMDQTRNGLFTTPKALEEIAAYEEMLDHVLPHPISSEGVQVAIKDLIEVFAYVQCLIKFEDITSDATRKVLTGKEGDALEPIEVIIGHYALVMFMLLTAQIKLNVRAVGDNSMGGLIQALMQAMEDSSD